MHALFFVFCKAIVQRCLWVCGTQGIFVRYLTYMITSNVLSTETSAYFAQFIKTNAVSAWTQDQSSQVCLIVRL